MRLCCRMLKTKMSDAGSSRRVARNAGRDITARISDYCMYHGGKHEGRFRNENCKTPPVSNVGVTCPGSLILHRQARRSRCPSTVQWHHVPVCMDLGCAPWGPASSYGHRSPGKCMPRQILRPPILDVMNQSGRRLNLPRLFQFVVTGTRMTSSTTPCDASLENVCIQVFAGPWILALEYIATRRSSGCQREQ
jgi:hypothetical protein